MYDVVLYNARRHDGVIVLLQLDGIEVVVVASFAAFTISIGSGTGWRNAVERMERMVEKYVVGDITSICSARMEGME